MNRGVVVVLPEITDKGREIIVRYRRPSGGAVRSFDFVLRYLNGADVTFTLTAERKQNGRWKALEAAICVGETDADPEAAARDLAGVQWRIFPAKERGRVLPPVVALWQKNGLTLAACLPDRYGGEHLPLAKQEKWFASNPEESPPDPNRFLCWWPDAAAWDAVKQSASYLKLFPARGMAVNFFTFKEWFRRADVTRRMDEQLAELEEVEEMEPDVRAEVFAEMKAEEYARYVRRVRTMLLYCREKGIPVKLVAGDTRRAEAYFAEKKLDPLDPTAWAAASSAFEEMPEFLVEEQGPCGPLGVAASNQKVRAAVSFYSHWPDASPCVDAVGAAVCAGAKLLTGLVVWLNPLADWKAASEKAVDALSGELFRRGVKEVVAVDGVLPFEACPCCEGLPLRVPDGWAREPVRTEKVGRNDPCPCGSGLKYKKCCGRA